MNGPGDIPISNCTATERPCGFSLLPSLGMSCRGRAEAFARHLSSKLRTLGNAQTGDSPMHDDDSILNNSNGPNTWITHVDQSNQVVTALQPLRHSTSQEAAPDSFFDFDCEIESPGSPVDECEYSRLIETTSNTPHDCATESGYICSSPITITDGDSQASSHSSDGPYFDPISSDGEQLSDTISSSAIKQQQSQSQFQLNGQIKFNNNNYKHTTTPVDVEDKTIITTTSNHSNNTTATTTTNMNKTDNVMMLMNGHCICDDDNNDDDDDDDDDDGGGDVIRNNTEDEVDFNHFINNQIENDKSNIITSTTIATDKNNYENTEDNNTVINDFKFNDDDLNHSDNNNKDRTTNQSNNNNNHNRYCNEVNNDAEGRESSPTQNGDNNYCLLSPTTQHSDKILDQEKIIDELQKLSEENELNLSNGHCHTEIDDSEDINGISMNGQNNILKLEVSVQPSPPTTPKSIINDESQKLIDQTTVVNGNLTTTNQHVNENNLNHENDENHHHNSTNNKDDTDDDDDCRPQRVRRCSSLKTGKTPPGTPGRKKIVRFADVLGLDLADVKTFMDEIPNIPVSAYQDLEIASELNEPPIQMGPKADKILMPLFQPPGCIPSFLDMVRDKQVNLENAIISDPINLTINGSVRVRNLDFHKSVHIRYTSDHWRTFSDIPAIYCPNSCDGFSDKFTFTIYANSLSIGQRLEFAARFQCKGQQFWDNNYGANYCFQCLPATNTPSNRHIIPLHHIPGSLISPTSDVWCASFY